MEENTAQWVLLIIAVAVATFAHIQWRWARKGLEDERKTSAKAAAEALNREANLFVLSTEIVLSALELHPELDLYLDKYTKPVNDAYALFLKASLSLNDEAWGELMGLWGIKSE